MTPDMPEMVSIPLPIDGARVISTSVDSEMTLIAFDNGVIMQIKGEWTLEGMGSLKSE